MIFKAGLFLVIFSTLSSVKPHEGTVGTGIGGRAVSSCPAPIPGMAEIRQLWTICKSTSTDMWLDRVIETDIIPAGAAPTSQGDGLFVDTRRLPAGVYFIEAVAGNHRAAAKTVLVE